MLVRQKLIPLQSLSRRCVGLGCAQFTWGAAAVLTAVFCIIWPVMTIPAGVFSLGYFYFFVIVWPVMTIPAGVFSLGYFYFFVPVDGVSMAWGLVRTPSPLPVLRVGSITSATLSAI